MVKENEEKAKLWLEVAQRQRLHWSTMITTLLGFTVVAFVGVWSYLLPRYIESDGARPAYFLVGAAASSLILGLWRIYTYYIDKQIVNLYPQLIYCEAILEVPEGMGVTQYLIHEAKELGELKLPKHSLDADAKMQVITKLVESKRIGSRLHSTINNWVLAYIVVIFLLGIASIVKVGILTQVWNLTKGWNLTDDFWKLLLYVILLILVLFGLILVSMAKYKSQKNPTDTDVKEAINAIKWLRGISPQG